MSTRITRKRDGDWEHDPHYNVSATTFLVHPLLKIQTANNYVVSYISTHMLSLHYCCLLIPNAPYNRYLAGSGTLAMQDFQTQWRHYASKSNERGGGDGGGRAES